MPDQPVVEIAKCVTNSLNNRRFSRSFHARLDLVAEVKAEDQELHVVVVPLADEAVISSRTELDHTYEVAVAVFKQFGDPTHEVQDLLLFMQELKRYLAAEKYQGGYLWIGISNAPIYDSEQLRSQRQFVSIVVVKYRAIIDRADPEEFSIESVETLPIIVTPPSPSGGDGSDPANPPIPPTPSPGFVPLWQAIGATGSQIAFAGNVETLISAPNQAYWPRKLGHFFTALTPGELTDYEAGTPNAIVRYADGIATYKTAVPTAIVGTGMSGAFVNPLSVQLAYPYWPNSVHIDDNGFQTGWLQYRTAPAGNAQDANGKSYRVDLSIEAARNHFADKCIERALFLQQEAGVEYLWRDNVAHPGVYSDVYSDNFHWWENMANARRIKEAINAEGMYLIQNISTNWRSQNFPTSDLDLAALSIDGWMAEGPAPSSYATATVLADIIGRMRYAADVGIVLWFISLGKSSPGSDGYNRLCTITSAENHPSGGMRIFLDAATPHYLEGNLIRRDVILENLHASLNGFYIGGVADTNLEIEDATTLRFPNVTQVGTLSPGPTAKLRVLYADEEFQSVLAYAVAAGGANRRVLAWHSLGNTPSINRWQELWDDLGPPGDADGTIHYDAIDANGYSRDTWLDTPNGRLHFDVIARRRWIT